MASAMFSVIC